MLDKAKLAKVLAMTTSTTDTEALAAVRMANTMIAREGMVWEDVLATMAPALNIVLSRTPYQAAPGEEWVPPHLKDTVVIDLMFRTVYAQTRTGAMPGFWDWVDDVHNKWRTHRSLTQGQYDALRRCYKRATRATV